MRGCGLAIDTIPKSLISKNGLSRADIQAQLSTPTQLNKLTVYKSVGRVVYVPGTITSNMLVFTLSTFQYFHKELAPENIPDETDEELGNPGRIVTTCVRQTKNSEDPVHGIDGVPSSLGADWRSQCRDRLTHPAPPQTALLMASLMAPFQAFVLDHRVSSSTFYESVVGEWLDRLHLIVI